MDLARRASRSRSWGAILPTEDLTHGHRIWRPAPLQSWSVAHPPDLRPGDGRTRRAKTVWVVRRVRASRNWRGLRIPGLSSRTSLRFRRRVKRVRWRLAVRAWFPGTRWAGAHTRGDARRLDRRPLAERTLCRDERSRSAAPLRNGRRGNQHDRVRELLSRRRAGTLREVDARTHWTRANGRSAWGHCQSSSQNETAHNSDCLRSR